MTTINCPKHACLADHGCPRPVVCAPVSWRPNLFEFEMSVSRMWKTVQDPPICDDASLRRTYKLCGKTLTPELGFKYHVAMHEGPYRYHCQFCGRGVSSNSNLKGNFVQHTGIMASVCHICQEEFTYGYILNIHMQRYHATSAS